MLIKTRGLVLNTINYNDKYILVNVFTETLGKVTYMVAKKRGAKTSRSFFSPLSILEIDADHQVSRDIQRIKEVRNELYLHSLHTDMRKTSVALFLSEFLSRILKDTTDSKYTFNFLYQSMSILEISERGIANFHLVFMLKLTRFLGFYPNTENYIKRAFFDLLNSEFTQSRPLHRHYLSPVQSEVFFLFSRISYENMHLFRFSRTNRTEIINYILQYYRLHLYDFPALKSLDILHELF